MSHPYVRLLPWRAPFSPTGRARATRQKMHGGMVHQ